MINIERIKNNMKSNENLLVVAMEECAEIQQDISKALRFGASNYPPSNPNITNGENIMKEFNQLRAVMDMLVLRGIISPLSESEQNRIYRDKIDAVEKWEQYSKNIGQIS